MDAAVVKLDALADAVGTAAEDHDLLAVGALGFVALATLFGALTASTTLGESLLPILLFPLLVPMVVYGASASGRLLAGRPIAEVAGQGRMLAAFAVLALGAGAALFGQIVEE